MVRIFKVIPLTVALCTGIIAQISSPITSQRLPDIGKVTINPKIKDSSIFRKNPDLIVLASHNFQKTSDERYNVTIKIKNNSTTAIDSPFFVCLRDMYSSHIYKKQISTLASNSTKVITFNDVRVQLQPYDQIDVTVDCQNNINETNEKNNFRSFIIQ